MQARIRSALKATAPAACLKIDLKKTDAGYTATLADEHFAGPTDYFLVIRSKRAAKAVIELVEDGNRFKVMPASLATRAVYGVKVEKEELPPPHLNIPRGSVALTLP